MCIQFKNKYDWDLKINVVLNFVFFKAFRRYAPFSKDIWMVAGLLANPHLFILFRRYA